jgi:hypothetical protein
MYEKIIYNRICNTSLNYAKTFLLAYGYKLNGLDKFSVAHYVSVEMNEERDFSNCSSKEVYEYLYDFVKRTSPFIYEKIERL